MEKFFSQKRILVYIIIALLVFNLATIAGLFFYKKTSIQDPPERWNHKMKAKGDFIKQKLNLSSEQLKEYQVYHDEFWQKGKVMVDSLQLIRKQLLDEVLKTHPDTTQISLLNQKFGNLHVSLKNNTIDFYFRLRNICTPPQQDTLKVIITRMLEFEGGRRPFKKHFKEREADNHD